ncbi:uracil DNA glycosylase [Saccharomonospora marina XMU15]|uniref:Uracil-DNA glycosylase n=1 Tax=Saccharomonospora marina XMU15 TaxID=882083 RepID=H5WYI7_9PSEU|nr:uracil DNA glycosylase [Saccharomonospora marina XMU15]
MGESGELVGESGELVGESGGLAEGVRLVPPGELSSRAVTARPLHEIVDPGWACALEPVADQIAAMGEFLRAEVAEGRTYLPSGENILRAFKQPFDEVRALIVGQDPYPTPGHPIGLCFAVAPDVRPLPKSLVNIFKEYCDDLGHPQPSTGDLTPWTEQGVLLLNRALTVRPGKPNSHQGKGWEKITEQAITALAARDKPLVAILWGSNARKLKPLLGSVPCVESVHPSPLSAHNGFFGSRPFSSTNELLRRQGAEPIDWKLP